MASRLLSAASEFDLPIGVVAFNGGINACAEGSCDFIVRGSGLRVQDVGSRFRVKGLRFRFWDSGHHLGNQTGI